MSKDAFQSNPRLQGMLLQAVAGAAEVPADYASITAITATSAARRAAGTAVSMEVLGPSATALGQLTQERISERLAGMPELPAMKVHSLSVSEINPPEPPREPQLVVAEEDDGWNTTSLSDAQLIILIVAVILAFFAMLAFCCWLNARQKALYANQTLPPKQNLDTAEVAAPEPFSPQPPLDSSATLAYPSPDYQPIGLINPGPPPPPAGFQAVYELPALTATLAPPPPPEVYLPSLGPAPSAEVPVDISLLAPRTPPTQDPAAVYFA